MNHRSTVLLLCPAVAGLAVLLIALRRQCKSSAALGQISESLRESVKETRALHTTLRRQRGAINDIHRYLIVPVSKGSPQAAH